MTQSRGRVGAAGMPLHFHPPSSSLHSPESQFQQHQPPENQSCEEESFALILRGEDEEAEESVGTSAGQGERVGG